MIPQSMGFKSLPSASQHSSGNKKMEDDANKDTEKKIEEIKKIGNDKGSKVVTDLLSAVTDVKPVPPSKS